jgi:hypothetical protein
VYTFFIPPLVIATTFPFLFHRPVYLLPSSSCCSYNYTTYMWGSVAIMMYPNIKRERRAETCLCTFFSLSLALFIRYYLIFLYSRQIINAAHQEDNIIKPTAWRNFFRSCKFSSLQSRSKFSHKSSRASHDVVREKFSLCVRC